MEAVAKPEIGSDLEEIKVVAEFMVQTGQIQNRWLTGRRGLVSYNKEAYRNCN